MDFDFNLILVPLTLGFFVIWLADKLILKQRKTHGKGNEPSAVVRWAYELFPILAVVLVVRSFFYEPYNIPSDSMVPTLRTGDYILVDKNAYGVRLPLLHTKIIDSGEPARGDVAVFRFPLQPSIYFIKRIIGLPGDTVSFSNGQLTINGEPAPIEPLPTNQQADDFSTLFQEQIDTHTFTSRYLNGVNSARQALFIQQNALGSTDGTQWSITVPQDQYFALGDNRDESQDSRFWGFVPAENLSGRAIVVWMHKEPGLHLPSFSTVRTIH